MSTPPSRPESMASRDLVIDRVTLVFHGRGDPVLALDRASLALPGGGFGAIIGPSGCGKSTLLRLVADILRPDAGSIRLGGQTQRQARQEHAIGFVFQQPTLLPWRSVLQNVELPLAIVGRGNGRGAGMLRARLLDWCALTGVA